MILNKDVSYRNHYTSLTEKDIKGQLALQRLFGGCGFKPPKVPSKKRGEACALLMVLIGMISFSDILIL